MDDSRFRTTLGRFATGVTVIITKTASQVWHSMTVNAFTSASLNPPLVVFLADNHSETLTALGQCGVFTVSILSDQQEQQSRHFAAQGRRHAVFSTISYGVSGSGLPYLAESLAYLDCLVNALWPAGDHQIVVGYVDALTSLQVGHPLLFFQGQYYQPRAVPSP